MSNENTTNDSRSVTGFNPSALFFPQDTTRAPVDESVEEGGETSPTITDDATIVAPVDGDPAAPITAGTFWKLGETEYNEEQVNNALKHADTFERFNQSIAPLVQNIKGFGDQAARFQAMAVTECDNQIKELTTELQSGRLDAQQYQLAHQALTSAELRKASLIAAGNQVAQQRQQALQNTRHHNLSQVATNLARAGWSMDKMKNAQGLAISAGLSFDSFADVANPALMEIFHDAFEYRAQREAAAQRLKKEGRKVVRTHTKTTTAAPETKKKGEMGDADWISKNIWGAK
ncbi:hypothetical protein [Pluralibacter sp.]|uniref:hypothetical protein n=1 Tax=Pluralibacter sp. TaxID=1920032 RepID=UPI0025CEFA73|nr:hypothetical protein [Pluralibacter sp.]MBV8042372.1 hypothetical protein [Pluralibacter sp.]